MRPNRKKKTNYRITIGYKAVVSVDVKTEDENIHKHTPDGNIYIQAPSKYAYDTLLENGFSITPVALDTFKISKL